LDLTVKELSDMMAGKNVMRGLAIAASIWVVATLLAAPASAENAGGEFPGRMGEPTVPSKEASSDEPGHSSVVPVLMFIMLAPAALLAFLWNHWRRGPAGGRVARGTPAAHKSPGPVGGSTPSGDEPTARIFNMDAEAVVVCDCPDCRAIRALSAP